MKFNTVASLIALAATAYAQNRNCGTQCDPKISPNSVMSGEIKVVEVKYKVGGNVVVENDCILKVTDFYIEPAPTNANWHCSGANNDGIWISKDTVTAVSKDTPQTLTYDVTNTDRFCHGSLVNDCDKFILIDHLADGSWQTIADATVKSTGQAPDPNAGANAGSSSGSSSASTGAASTGSSNTGSSNTGSTPSGTTGAGASSSSSTKQTTAASGNKTSDATTSKWSMALIGLTSLAACLLA